MVDAHVDISIRPLPSAYATALAVRRTLLQQHHLTAGTISVTVLKIEDGGTAGH